MGLWKPAVGETWLGLTGEPLPVERVLVWVGRPDCGAVVLFSGNARNYAEGRPNVTGLAYEAYEEQVVPRLQQMADEARRRWASVGRLAVLHRTGPVEIGEATVVVAVSAPHREEAFAVGRWCIDTLKETLPIWKRETWEGGEHWGLEAQHIVEVDATGPRYAADVDESFPGTRIDSPVGRESPGDGT